MRKTLSNIYKLIAAVILMSSACSCGKEIDNGSGGFILFSSTLETKVPIITDMKDRSFDVIAFEYSTDWGISKARALPTDKFPFPTPVECNAITGLCSYDAQLGSTGNSLVEWATGKTYAFFAYYPKHDEGNVTLTTTESSQGVPVISYAQPLGENNADSMSDVMISPVIDKTGAGDGVVNFEFRHQLAMIIVEALNVNENSEFIRNLKVSFTGPIFKYLDIPLDGQNIQAREFTASGTESAKYTINTVSLSSSEGLELTGRDVNGEIAQISEDKNITMIPISRTDVGEGQPALSGKITFERKNSHGTWDSVESDFSTETDIEAGKKYSLLITFSDDAISLSVISAGDWIEMSQTITFE